MATPRFHTMCPHTRRMSEARRNHIHGKLHPLDWKGRPVIKGELQWLLPWITLASGLVVAAIGWGLLS